MKKLNIVDRSLKLRTSFKAKDGTDRVLFDVPHTMDRIRKNPNRNWIADKYITKKAIEAANIIVTKYRDRPNAGHGQSYFITVTKPYVNYTDKTQGYVGFPLHWKSPQGDKFVLQYTDQNFGKLTTFIVRKDQLVRPSSKHQDIPMKIANSNYILLEIP